MVNVLDTTAVALRKGTREENESFVGIQAELVADLGNPDESGIVGVDGNVTLRLHNGYTPGGIPMARADMKNMTTRALAENRPTLGDRNLAYANLTNLEVTTDPTAQRNIVDTLSSYGLATDADLENYAKKDMTNVNTADLAESHGHQGTNLAYADLSNVNTTNLTLDRTPEEGPTLAKADFGNISDETWTDVTNEHILPIVQEGVEFTENKDAEINKYVVVPGHYPSTQAVVDFIEEETGDFLEKDFSNVSTWEPLYYAEGETTYKYISTVLQSDNRFSAGETYLTEYILDPEFRQELVFQVVNATQDGTLTSPNDIKLLQYVGEVDLTGKILKITSNTRVDAYITVESELDEDADETIYRHTITAISCPQNAGFEYTTYENTGDTVYVAKRLEAKVTEVDEYGQILKVETVPSTGTIKIYDDEESGDDNPRTIYIYGDEDNGAYMVVASDPLTPEIGGAGLLKMNLSNLPGMTTVDAELAEEAPWCINHMEALPGSSGELSDRDTYRIPTVREVVQAIENGGGGGGGGAGLTRISLIQSSWVLQPSGLYHYNVPNTADVVAVYRSVGNIYTLIECDIDNDGSSAVIKSKDAFDGFAYTTTDEGSVQTKGTVPLLSTLWSDHLLQDQTWLRADTFSWHSGDTFKAPYEELVAQLQGAATETDDQGITYQRTSKGYKIVLSDDDTAVANLYTSTGVAWYYILDVENRRFKLPRTQYSFDGVRNRVGNYIEPGLPNITGSVNFSRCEINSTDGAFRLTESRTAIGANSDRPTGLVSFDASRSNSIYGASDTVQPPATQMYLYFYVGGFSESATEINAGINVEALNNKVDRSDLTDVSAIIETYSNGVNWYRVWTDGWIEQGGTVSLNGVISSTNKRVTFLKPFTSTPYVYCSQNANTGVADAMVGWESTTEFSIGTLSSSSTGHTNWYACGY